MSDYNDLPDMRTIKDFSDIEMQKELKRRKKEKKIPQPLSSDEVDVDKIRNTAIEYMKERHSENFYDDDWDHWFYECVIEAFYGKGIWDYLNKLEE